MPKKADEAFSVAGMLALAVGAAMFVTAWINNELPSWLMRLIAVAFHASPTGGRG